MALSPMKKIDEFLFKQCDEIKKTSNYQKIADQVSSSIEDESKSLVATITTALLIFIFFTFILFFYFKAYGVSKNIEAKQEIAQEAKKFLALYSSSNKTMTKILSPRPVKNSADLQGLIQASLGAIKKESINLTNDDVEEISPGLFQATGQVNFNQINNRELAIFINNMASQSKVRFVESNIQREPDSQLLNGHISIMHFSK